MEGDSAYFVRGSLNDRKQRLLRARLFRLELGVLWSAGERDHITNVGHARQQQHDTLQTQAKPSQVVTQS